MIPRIKDILVLLTCITQTTALYCLSCTDSVSPRHCHTVRKCSDGEVCYTESHSSENGLTVFDTGCASPQSCQLHPEADVRTLHGVDPNYHRCMECCSSHLCNNQGCGQPGYPLSRGPVCFNCPQVSDPMLCDKLKVCELNQACYLQRELEFGDVYYISRCIDNHACVSSLSSVDIIGKRNIEKCSKCCQEDLCNNQCFDMFSSMSSTTTTLKTTTPADSTMRPTNSMSTTQQTYTGSRGTEFLILFMHNWSNAPKNLSIYITTENNSEVKISSSPSLKVNIRLSVDKTINITYDSLVSFPFDLQCEYMKIEPKGLIVQTSELSTVTIFDSIHTSDGTLIIPTNELSTNYLVSSTESYNTAYDFSQFAMLPLSDGARIKINLKMKGTSSITLFGRTYRDGDIIPLYLNRFETFQFGHTTDLSGTLISSTKPLAVFSGNRCHWYGLSNDCGHMVTQLPPVSKLDSQYVVPPFYKNLKTLIQVISLNQTFVNCSTGQNVSRWHLNAQQYKKLEVTNEITTLISESPVLVTGFGMGNRNFNPYMTVIPGVNQFVDYYKITVPAGYTENFISVIIPEESANNLRINGSTSYQYKIVYQNNAVVGKTFNVRTFEVKSGAWVLNTTDRSKFGLIVFGYRTQNGYGFAGNFVLP